MAPAGAGGENEACAERWGCRAVGNRIRRANFAASTMLCRPGSLSQPGGYGLGTQGGPTRRLELFAEAGFADPIVAADTGFNLVLSATKRA